MKRLFIFFVPIAAAALFGCDKGTGTASQGGPNEKPGEAAQPPSNRIDVPPAVRQNLGITFAKVERRRVASTIRVPGRFELLPTARREHRATLPGHVRIFVSQYQEVKKGTPLFQLDSPEWHKLRQELHAEQATVEKATAELAVAEQEKVEAEGAVERTRKRIDAMAGAEFRRAELETELAKARGSIPRLEAQIRARQVEVREARRAFPIAIASAASLLGVSPEFLTSEDAAPDGPVQRWRAINQIEYAAAAPGVVESIGVNSGAWIEQNAHVMTVVDPTAIRFHAVGLQSDLGRLKDGLDALIVPPQGAGNDGHEPLPGKLKVGLGANPDQRTIELLVAPEKAAKWAKAGVSTFLEVYVDDSGQPELAIPVSSVIRDELQQVFFRRDPRNLDKVIRIEGDLGLSDGKWVVVNSGVALGDEVVLDGVYELKLAGGGKAAAGGHFHADGTWHADGTPEPK